MSSPNKRAINRTGHHNTKYGSIEVFFIDKKDWPTKAMADLETGWYYWSCCPECLPDGDPIGPFNTSDEAYADAGGE